VPFPPWVCRCPPHTQHYNSVSNRTGNAVWCVSLLPRITRWWFDSVRGTVRALSVELSVWLFAIVDMFKLTSLLQRSSVDRGDLQTVTMFALLSSHKNDPLLFAVVVSHRIHYCCHCCRPLRTRRLHTHCCDQFHRSRPLLFLDRATSWIDCRRSLFLQLSFKYVGRFEARRS
jgi:hypothetical protein